MRLRRFFLFFLGLIFFVYSGRFAFASDSDWVIKKTFWSVSDEKGFSDFVFTLGSSGCGTVDSCLKSPANPYRASDPKNAYWDADCGKFPYLLRAYYAWKNFLPFSYASDVAAVGASADQQEDEWGDPIPPDLRYSAKGNYVTQRIDLVGHSSGRSLNGYRELRRMQDEVNTAMYRIHPLRDGARDGKNFSDFYSVAIDRTSIRPGTVIYDAAGHATMVYKVETDGRIRYFDAHPDKTVSHGVYGEKFARSRPSAGAGFKNFRPLILVGAKPTENGDWLGGKVLSAAVLTALPGFSVEQYWGTDAASPRPDSGWTRAKFRFEGKVLNYYDYVRRRLAVGQLRYHPIVEMQNAIEALCGDLNDRITAVNTALAAGPARKTHPSKLPNNIYGTEGEWEEFSSPSRDARLKTSFRELRVRVEQMVDLYQQDDPSIDYAGVDLASDLRSAYAQSAAACKVSYTKTGGATKELTYSDVARRLFALSFDPYQCAELRWGATSADELASCADGSEKLAWYHAEQRLRNQVERTYDVHMSFTLSDLERRVANTGVDRPPDIDLDLYLASLQTPARPPR